MLHVRKCCVNSLKDRCVSIINFTFPSTFPCTESTFWGDWMCKRGNDYNSLMFRWKVLSMFELYASGISSFSCNSKITRTEICKLAYYSLYGMVCNYEIKMPHCCTFLPLNWRWMNVEIDFAMEPWSDDDDDGFWALDMSPYRGQQGAQYPSQIL